MSILMSRNTKNRPQHVNHAECEDAGPGRDGPWTSALTRTHSLCIDGIFCLYLSEEKQKKIKTA